MEDECDNGEQSLRSNEKYKTAISQHQSSFSLTYCKSPLKRFLFQSFISRTITQSVFFFVLCYNLFQTSPLVLMSLLHGYLTLKKQLQQQLVAISVCVYDWPPPMAEESLPDWRLGLPLCQKTNKKGFFNKYSRFL